MYVYVVLYFYNKIKIYIRIYNTNDNLVFIVYFHNFKKLLRKIEN